MIKSGEHARVGEGILPDHVRPFPEPVAILSLTKTIRIIYNLIIFVRCSYVRDACNANGYVTVRIAKILFVRDRTNSQNSILT